MMVREKNAQQIHKLKKNLNLRKRSESSGVDEKDIKV